MATNGEELINMVHSKKPDVVITDIDLPIMNGIASTRIITKNYPNTGVIAFSMFEEQSAVMEILHAGARGYLLKHASKFEICQAIKTVYDKGNYFSNSTSSKLIKLISQSEFNPYNPGKKPNFTDKELAIIKLICKEYSNKEIASELNLSTRSVESSRERIQIKIGAKNMVGIALFAYKYNLISTTEIHQEHKKQLLHS
jgi:DNA-binding NarL/FixJ family response regulator